MDRVSRLKEEVRRLSPAFCIERAYLMTESYKETEGQPPVIRRAKALEKILKDMTVHIDDGELLVGRATSKRFAGPLLPEIQWQWYVTELDQVSKRGSDRIEELSEAEKDKVKEIVAYWKGKSLYEAWDSVVPGQFKELSFLAWTSGGANPVVCNHMGHCCPGFERVLTGGVNNLIARIDKRLGELTLSKVDEFQSYLYLTAMKITLNALVVFAGRYAELAGSMALKETDRKRKAELLTIAEICKRVPANPAHSFYEAMQSLWFTYVAVMLEGWAPGVGFGRMDQYLFPFYQEDLKNGRTTEEKVRELIALFYIKLNELAKPFPISSSNKQGGSGNITLSGITLGGIARDKANVADDLTYLFLEAEQDVILREDLTFRVHSSVSDYLLIKACEVAKQVKGKIKFVSDETIIQQQLNDGKPIELARDYAITGCFIHTIPGYTHDPGADFLNPAMMLELALNNGVSRMTSKQIGPATGDPRTFKSYDEVWQAYKTQISTLVPYCISGINLYSQLFGEFLPSPLQSSLYDGCIERGLDVMNGGTAPYATLGLWVAGIPTVGDSLAAIKKAVFDDKKLTMTQLIRALDTNFEGEEEVLHILKSAPKFGNDDNYVDLIVNDVLVNLSDELGKHRAFADRKYTLSAAAILAHLVFGRSTGALPDGRKAGEPLSEGGISPYQGRNVNGPTSTIRSVAKLNLIRCSGGAVLNLKFNPDGLTDKTKMEKFACLLRNFCETGGDLIQFNIVSNDMLREAQKNPDQYRDLLVRVATYSAYFVELPVEVQNEILERTEFEGM